MFGDSLVLVEKLFQAFPEKDRGRAPPNNTCSALQEVLPRSSSILLGRGDNKDFPLEFISQQQLAFIFQTEPTVFNKNHVKKC